MALDPSYFFYSEGTISVTNGSDIATGEFTAWDPAVLPFDFVLPNNGTDGMTVIKEVLAMDQIQLAKPWTGPTLTNVPYFMVRWTRHTDPRIYALRVSEYLTRLKALPENFDALAEEISEGIGAYQAAVQTLEQVEAAVAADRDATATDRAAVETAVTTATDKADQAAVSATDAAYYASLVGALAFDFGTLADPSTSDLDMGTL